MGEYVLGRRTEGDIAVHHGLEEGAEGRRGQEDAVLERIFELQKQNHRTLNIVVKATVVAKTTDRRHGSIQCIKPCVT